MRLIERTFSDNDECPSVLLVNSGMVPDVAANLSQMDAVIQVAHEKGVNKERDDFDDHIDFARFYREIQEAGSCPTQLD